MLRATLDSAGARAVSLHTTIGATDHRLDHPLAHGANEVEWTVTVDRPALWWPRALGPATLHDLGVRVVLDGDGGGDGEGDREIVSDERRLRTGLRQVRMRRWVASVNGERLFLKGSNQGPTRMALAEATPAELARDVDLALDAGLDFLRLHAHISRPELYDAADERGLLLWQDLPLQWGYAREVRHQAIRQAAAAVELLGHHPSIALWCGHNEPMAIENDPAMWGDPKALRRMGIRALAAQELPTWNKTVLDRSVKRALERADGTRPVVAHSGVLPHPPQLDGTDSHLYFGWYHGHERDLPGFLRRVPRMGRFVTEFGAQAVPSTADFCEPERWPDLDWGGSGARTPCRSRSSTASSRPRSTPPSTPGATPRRPTRRWSCDDRSRPCDASSTPRRAASPSSASPTGTRRSRGPCSATTGPPSSGSTPCGRPAARSSWSPTACPSGCAPARQLDLDVHVVSDLRTPIDPAEVEARLVWTGGERTWRWSGVVPADACERVGRVHARVPDAAGPLSLELCCRFGDEVVENRYDATIDG